MNIKDYIKPISYIKTNAAEMLKKVNETHNPIIITQNGEPKAVLLDTQTYQSMRDSIGILKILSQSEKDIEREHLYTQEDVFIEIDKKIEKLKEDYKGGLKKFKR